MEKNTHDETDPLPAQRAALGPADSALYWLPRLSDLDFPMPETRTVLYDHRDAVQALEDESAKHRPDFKAMEIGAAEIGYPVFMRSDLASAKHGGPKEYRAENALDIKRIFWSIVEDGEMKFWLGPESPRAIMLREWIDINARFSAFGGHPIGNEWRFFSDGKDIICRHFYWPTEAIDFYGKPPVRDWKRLLSETKRMSVREHDLLRGAVLGAARRMDGSIWSIDFAQDKSGIWWLIDMAHGCNSWHPETCRKHGLIRGTVPKRGKGAAAQEG